MNNSEANRQSHRFASGVGIAKTNTNGTQTLTDKDVLSSPVIMHVYQAAAPEVYAAARQSPLCKRVIAKANSVHGDAKRREDKAGSSAVPGERPAQHHRQGAVAYGKGSSNGGMGSERASLLHPNKARWETAQGRQLEAGYPAGHPAERSAPGKCDRDRGTVHRGGAAEGCSSTRGT